MKRLRIGVFYDENKIFKIRLDKLGKKSYYITEQENGICCIAKIV